MQKQDNQHIFKGFLVFDNYDEELTRRVIESFRKVVDLDNDCIHGHSFRTAAYTAMLSKELGYDRKTILRHYHIALMHDIGKTKLPKKLLDKPGRLTKEEFELIKSHPIMGYEILKDIQVMPGLAIGARWHHERPDGRGYPDGLRGDEIPRVAQIIAVADTFDAMYSDRPYRARMNFECAVKIIKDVSGTQLTPDVVDAFLRLVDHGAFRAADDTGGGSTEDIRNIHSHAVS